MLKRERGANIDALAVEAIALFPGHLGLQWIAAQRAMDRGDLETARPILERLTSIDPDTFFDPELAYDKTLFRHASAEMLALCYFRGGHFGDAARLYHIAARTSPDPAALRTQGRPGEGQDAGLARPVRQSVADSNRST